MPMSNNHEVSPFLRFRDNWGELLHSLYKGRVFPLDNSTRHYGAFLLRGLLTYNMTLSNNSRMDNNSDYDQDAATDGHDDCSPFMDVFDFLHLYYLPAIILTGMLALRGSIYLFNPAPTVKIAFL
jgi:hypothetical protein